MFERYTEKARRTVFFARYEASQLGSAYIETEHILLGLLREDWALVSRLLPNLSHEAVREELASHLPKAPSVPTSVDLPLSKEAKSVLSHAAEEAARLADPHIGNEHMLLGLLREPETYSAQLLHRSGARLTELRLQISKTANRSLASHRRYPDPPPSLNDTVEIHGSQFNADHVREAIAKCREFSWHWHQRAWKPRDIVVERNLGAVSFDVGLAEDSANFELIKEGWKKDHCAICHWELSASGDDAQRGTGYTNGRDWLCLECYEKFFGRPGFFSSSYPEIT